MNFLVHLYLSGKDTEIMVGNFMGDFVKGRVGAEYPSRIREGIVLHRRIDRFAQDHPSFRQSRLRISPCYGHYRGVMVDLFYDHFLVNEWESWSQEPLEAWLAGVRASVENQLFLFPGRLPELVPVIFDDLIPSYRHVSGIGQAMSRMSRRVSRSNPLSGGEVELTRHYDGLKEDFHHFMPDVIRFVRSSLHCLHH